MQLPCITIPTSQSPMDDSFSEAVDCLITTVIVSNLQCAKLLLSGVAFLSLSDYALLLTAPCSIVLDIENIPVLLLAVFTLQ
jgi:hypothetical protein